MSNMTMTTAPAITIRREIAVPAADLFDAWLDPELVAEWMRPGSFAKSVVRIDARAGGKFEILMQSPGGEVPHRGVYRKIDRPRQLVFTWISPHTQDRETLVTVDFLAKGAKATEIVVRHEGLPDEKAVAAHTGGWTTILERLSGGAGSQAHCGSAG